MSDIYGTGNPRDGITRTLMRIAQPPPVPPGQPSQIPGLDPSQGMMPTGQGMMSSPAAPASPQAGQPAMGMGGTGMALPGMMQPGQLPLGMNPQAAAGGSYPTQMPPRGY
jgi:hypothetical protein